MEQAAAADQVTSAVISSFVVLARHLCVSLERSPGHEIYVTIRFGFVLPLRRTRGSGRMQAARRGTRREFNHVRARTGGGPRAKLPAGRKRPTPGPTLSTTQRTAWASAPRRRSGSGHFRHNIDTSVYEETDALLRRADRTTSFREQRRPDAVAKNRQVNRRPPPQERV